MKIRKIVLLGLVAAGLLLIEFISMSNIGIVNVSATQWTGLNGPISVAIGDYDNDGLNDLAFTDRDNYRVMVYKSDGITIIKQWTITTQPWGVEIGDYDNDGLNDIAITDMPYMGGIGNVTVYKSDGVTIVKQWTGLDVGRDIAIGDYDNDGFNDLAFAEEGYPDHGKVTVYKNDGTTIIAQWTNLIAGCGVAIGDYDNDGLNDLALSERDAHRVTLYRNDGKTIVKQWTGIIMASCVEIGDYNNDGLNDIAFVEHHYGGEGKVTVYYQTKPGTVARVAEPTIVTLRGTLTNSTGYPIPSGSIRVTVKDSMGRQVWQDTFDNIIDNGRYNIPLGAKTTLMLIKGQIYNAVLEVDADSPTFVSADVIYGDNNPTGDIIKFVAN